MREWHDLVHEVFRFNLHTRDQWVAARATEVQPGNRVLDVGAGPCRYARFFEHCRYVALDFAVAPDAARRIDVIADALRLPFADEVFDVVLSTEVIEHVAEPIVSIREIALKSRWTPTLRYPFASVHSPHIDVHCVVAAKRRMGMFARVSGRGRLHLAINGFDSQPPFTCSSFFSDSENSPIDAVVLPSSADSRPAAVDLLVDEYSTSRICGHRTRIWPAAS